MGEIIAGIIGVLAFILTIWIYRQSHRERVSVDVYGGTRTEMHGPALFAKVCNMGQIPVYLQDVCLACGKDVNTGGDFNIDLKMTAVSSLERPLAVGDLREYMLPMVSPNRELLRSILDKPEAKIWLSVRSGKGEIFRVTGPKIEVLIESLLKDPGPTAEDQEGN